MKSSQTLLLSLVFTFILWNISACKSLKVDDSHLTQFEVIKKNYNIGGKEFELTFTAGKAHNYPSFAIWMENAEGKTMQTLFITQSVATGYYKYGDAGNGHWLKTPGVAVRPAALPYWLHRREQFYPDQHLMPSQNQPIPDAYTGATPKGNFQLKVKTHDNFENKFRVLVEVNQPWDWNTIWFNNKFPESANYRTSAQPSLIYAVDIDLNNLMPEYFLNPIGHGHPAGDDGKLYTDLKGFGTAFQIFSSIKLQAKQ